ncbi:amino acid adenylation domain-containing protein [Paenactinomyces guangxiensis]|uniref:Amino acid adenylation domain-containing protein n=1 Tax=Paenactinomyces guangxiensis TaxID=1490290 RepID=A0A7W1WSC3_9BACL|nr:amino acid adenylation domain-containing protein [Paenactinomyces guangxiensis]MBA4495173.1 amino acid adenylation domain-containing protein [Paenactinomyces guangxiensis]MBH8592143.1 amino acid adenylation domain-containing protein [Paenactinomyces guangxiensis]
MGHYETLLKAIAANPKQKISSIPLLTEMEKRKLLTEWNGTDTWFPNKKCIHELFEEQVDINPHAIAVIDREMRYSYLELNKRANKLAYFLQQKGVGPNVFVGICMDRTFDMIVGLLGILKAGGSYVPLDPDYPKERLAYIINDTKMNFLVTGQRNTDKHGVINRKTNADQLAYVIYTSGSTGQPKGVMIQHKQAVAMISWAKNVFSDEELAGVLASTSICFDLSIFEIFVPLCRGKKVILAENALYLAELPNAQEVTLINTVPTAIAELLKVEGIPRSVKVVNLAGEALDEKLVQQIYQKEWIEKVNNLYGPSETTTYSTYALIPRDPELKVHIGKPIANTQIYILDSEHQIVPIGVPGEIFIGGAGLSQGYLNQPELTAEKFIAHPFRSHQGEKLYKTGDLARFLSDGNIEYLGRQDYQVKIRGYRIETKEVEVVLKQHSAVKESVVMVKEGPDGNKRLIAFLTGKQPVPTIKEIRSYLLEKLPGFMVPSSFILLDSFPLTLNGKIDRKALLQMSQEMAEEEAGLILPRDWVELKMALKWEELLGVKSVGVNDNFFYLGGDS